MAVVFAVMFRDHGAIGPLTGVLVSGPLYLGFGYVMAKFGYQRKTMKELRANRVERSASDDEPDDTATPTRSARPAPTRRTSQGPNRPTRRKRR